MGLASLGGCPVPPTGANLDPIRAGLKQIIHSRPLISGSFGAYGSGCPPSTSQQIDTRLECVCVCVCVCLWLLLQVGIRTAVAVRMRRNKRSPRRDSLECLSRSDSSPVLPAFSLPDDVGKLRETLFLSSKLTIAISLDELLPNLQICAQDIH
ncbi:hypothetical protein C8Q69DRAFT_475823 [Paecilomyces variotii]|uniref:Uncharacterized protein n=1 Tax=Byssochlamys spectabilis TaxID=264951 RepID=A0A443HNE4_BYSSP|nr:hypothetical protein C8Q69DRAFT_475823 [Paecilomyces variotii]RWQ93301.1 hypothetical protein C8Q69DRAFT_475823 [Paecilomyces variotii]